MSRIRTTLGVILSVGWIIVAYFVYEGSTGPDKANEWGDHFAGMCSPLAFLWLVLGYLQQGDELKHSTEALKLQAKELQNAVEQQTQLVAIERDMFRHELAKSHDRDAEAHFLSRPRMRITQIQVAPQVGGHSNFLIRIFNDGADFSNVTFSDLGGNAVPIMRLGIFQMRSEYALNFVADARKFTVAIEGTTMQGKQAKYKFSLDIDAPATFPQIESAD